MSHIDKQATIDAIYEKANEELADANHHFLAGVHMAVDVVDQMPYVQPQRIRGRWEVYQLAEVGRAWTVQCSVCHAIGFHGQTPFCCECGADMRDGGKK